MWQQNSFTMAQWWQWQNPKDLMIQWRHGQRKGNYSMSWLWGPKLLRKKQSQRFKASVILVVETDWLSEVKMNISHWFRKVCFFICVEFEAPFQSWEGCQLRRRRRSWKSFRWSKNGRIYIANESRHVRCKWSDLIVFKVVAKKLERMLETTLGQVSCQGMNFSCFWL